MEIAEGLPWVVTSDERGCFFHFHCHTVPTLLEFFDSLRWQWLVLKIASSEPPFTTPWWRSLSAVHQDLEMHGLLLPGARLLNIRHRFALEQCDRSFAILGRSECVARPAFEGGNACMLPAVCCDMSTANSIHRCLPSLTKWSANFGGD